MFGMLLGLLAGEVKERGHNRITGAPHVITRLSVRETLAVVSQVPNSLSPRVGCVLHRCITGRVAWGSSAAVLVRTTDDFQALSSSLLSVVRVLP